MKTAEKLLEIKQLTKTYGQQPIVTNLNFQVDAGEWVGIVGQNGSGKTTLARMIMGLEPPSQGSIFYKGQSQTQFSLKEWVQQLQLVTQYTRNALDPLQTIAQLLQEPLVRFQLCSKNVRKQRIEAVLAQCDLPLELLTKRPRTLSGGQYQRVCLALALLVNPQILICDEATANLDKITERKILGFLKAQKKLTVLFISHDTQLVQQFCDKTIQMKG